MTQKVLSLRISDRRLTIAQVERGWGGSRLLGWLLLPLPPEGEADPEEAAGLAAGRIHEAGLQGDRVLLSLGASRAYVRRLAFPFSSREKIEQALPFEMETSLPLSREELVFDYLYLGKNSRGGYSVLAAALPRTEVKQWVQCLQKQGLDPARIDLDISGLFVLGSLGAERVSGSCLAVWHMGQRDSAIAVVRHGSLLQARSFRMGTEDLAGMLVERTGESLEEAGQRLQREVFSEADGNLGSGSGASEEDEAELCVRAAYRELSRVIWSIQNESPEAVVEDVLLTGAGAGLQGFCSALTAREGPRFHTLQELSLPSLEAAKDSPDLPEIAPAASAALFEGKKSAGWNFRKGDLAYQGAQGWKNSLIYGAAGLGIVLLCAVAAFSYHVSLKKSELQRVRARTEQVFREAAPEASDSLQRSQYESVLQNRILSYQEQSAGSSQEAAGSSPLDLLLYVSKSAPSGDSFRLRRINMDTEEALLVGDAGSYDTVNRIREEMLSQQKVSSVEIQGVTSNRDEDTVRFTLRVEQLK